MLETKSSKPVAQVLDRAPMLHMLGVDIGDDGDGGGQAVEGAVALVGLDHHPFALPHPRVGAVGVDDAAIDHRRVDAAGSSSAATIVVVVVLPWVPATATLDFSRISSASISARRTTGRPRGAGGVELGVAGLDRRGDHHDLGASRFSARWPIEDGGAQSGSRSVIFSLQVRALHL
jgi:hypothetical protein